MRSPDIVAVEEVQDNDGATDSAEDGRDADLDEVHRKGRGGRRAGATRSRRSTRRTARTAGQPGGNIRVGFLYRTDRGLSFVARPGGTATSATQVVDGPQAPS